MPDVGSVVKHLLQAESITLSTHRHCDGDGLGAQLALFHGLKKLGKHVRALNVDYPSPKYSFLGTDQIIEVFDPRDAPLAPCDIALIFDTNDGRLVEPLFSHLKTSCREILFIDHHPILHQGPQPTKGSLIETTAASTGEIAYAILRELGVEFDAEIARALYTSIVFDTQLFRFVKANPASYLIAAELLRYEREPEQVHQKLFSTYTVAKMRFLAWALSQVEYLAQDSIAFVHLRAEDFRKNGLEPDESGDVIDLIMNVGTVEAAALLREEGANHFKLSLRSKGRIEVLQVAENFGGGGHLASAGAFFEGKTDEVREKITTELRDLVRSHGRTSRKKSGPTK